MHSRITIIAAAALLASAGASAQPVKTPVPERNTSLNRTTPVVLASADRIVAPASAQVTNAGQAKRPRVGRVTTCRCGGDPQPESQEDQ